MPTHLLPAPLSQFLTLTLVFFCPGKLRLHTLFITHATCLPSSPRRNNISFRGGNLIAVSSDGRTAPCPSSSERNYLTLHNPLTPPARSRDKAAAPRPNPNRNRASPPPSHRTSRSPSPSHKPTSPGPAQDKASPTSSRSTSAPKFCNAKP